MWPIASTKKREAKTDRMPTTMNVRAGLCTLQPHLVRDLQQPASLLKDERDYSLLAMWTTERPIIPVVKPGPVMELTRSAIPPQKPISGLYILPTCSRQRLQAPAFERRKVVPIG